MSLELEVLSNTRKAQQDLSKLDLAVGNIQKSVEKNNVAGLAMDRSENMLAPMEVMCAIVVQTPK